MKRILIALIAVGAMLTCGVVACGQGFSEGQRWQEYTFRGGYWWKGGAPYNLQYYYKWGKKYARAVPANVTTIVNVNSNNTLADPGSTVSGYVQPSVRSLNDLTLALEVAKPFAALELLHGSNLAVQETARIVASGESSVIAQYVQGDAIVKSQIAAAKHEREKGEREALKLQRTQELMAQVQAMVEAADAGDVGTVTLNIVDGTISTPVQAFSTGYKLLDRCAKCHSGKADNGGGHVLFPLDVSNLAKMQKAVLEDRMPMADGESQPLSADEKLEFVSQLTVAVSEE